MISSCIFGLELNIKLEKKIGILLLPPRSCLKRMCRSVNQIIYRRSKIIASLTLEFISPEFHNSLLKIIIN